MGFPFAHLLAGNQSIPDPGLPVGDTTLISTGTRKAVSYSQITYLKYEEIQINYSGTFRLTFSSRLQNYSSNSHPRYNGLGVHTQIWKNGVPYGIEHLHAMRLDIRDMYFTEDLYFEAGDLIQLYAHNDEYPHLNNCSGMLAVKSAVAVPVPGVIVYEGGVCYL